MEDRFIIPHRQPLVFDEISNDSPEQISIASFLKRIIRKQNKKSVKKKFNSSNNLSPRRNSHKADIFDPFNFKTLQNIEDIFGLNFEEIQESPTIINKPERNLEAITLTDNHEASLLDCSFRGILAVGLSKGIYLWNKKGEIKRIRQRAGVWSLKWSSYYSNILACGSDRGSVEIWDAEKNRMIYQMNDRNRGGINSLTFQNNVLYSGSQNGSLYQQDLRLQKSQRRIFGFKNHQILTLKFQPNNNHYLGCSTMNGKLKIWDARNRKTVMKINVRSQNIEVSRQRQNLQKNVIRAFDWHPKNSNILVYGDNTEKQTQPNSQNSIPAEQTDSMNKGIIKVINISQNTEQQINVIKTKTQICNLLYSADGNHLYSSHGPQKNEIYRWNGCKNYKKQIIFGGHDARVLYLTLNEQQKMLISGAGDESIKFWKYESEKKQQDDYDHCMMQIR